MSRNDPLLTPHHVMTRKVHDAPLDAQKFLPNELAMKQSIRRAANLSHKFKEPFSTLTIDIPSRCHRTKRGKKFLIHDSGGSNRILIFSTKMNLKVNF